jgi:hypothetical protein
VATKDLNPEDLWLFGDRTEIRDFENICLILRWALRNGDVWCWEWPELEELALIRKSDAA